MVTWNSVASHYWPQDDPSRGRRLIPVWTLLQMQGCIQSDANKQLAWALELACGQQCVCLLKSRLVCTDALYSGICASPA